MGVAKRIDLARRGLTVAATVIQEANIELLRNCISSFALKITGISLTN